MNRRMRHNGGIVRNLPLLLASALAATALYAQQTPPTTSETIEVRVTNIDVVVTDAAGNPATGLTADDFELLERGTPRPITNFYEVRGTPASASVATPSAPAAPGTPATEPPAPPANIAHRRIIVYVDLFSVHPHQRTQMLDAFEKSLDQLMRPGDQAMLVTFNGVSSDVLTALTSDRTLLAAKLKEIAKKSGGNLAAEAQKESILDNAEMLLERAKVQTPGQPTGTSDAPASPTPTASTQSLTLEQAYSMARSPARSFAEQQYRKQKSLLSDLQRILGSLSGADGKKVLLYLGGELVENPGLELYQRIDAIFAPHLRQIQPVATRDPSRSFAVDIRTLAETANASNVTMYMVDASSRGGGDNDAGTMSLRRAESETMSLGETTRAMAQVADLTGGISVPAGKTIQTALDTIVRDLSSYYSLGYRSEEKAGGNIEVRVRKPGLRVRTRRTYDPNAQLAAAPPTPAATTPSPVVPPALAKASDALVRQRLLANVFDDVPSDFPVTVTADDLRRQQDGKYRVTLNVAFPSSVTLTDHNGTLKGQIAVYIVTNNEDGEMSPVTATVKPLTVTAADRTRITDHKPFTFTFPLVVQEGEVIVSVGVADQLGGTAGFAKTSVVAP
jgi:VWFA-related protein